MKAEFWRGRRVLITGHTGFKGSWLAAILDQAGSKILGISLPPNTTPSHFEILKGRLKMESAFLNINELKPLQQAIQKFKPEIVFHMAAQALVRESYKDPVETFATNIMGTVHVLESCRGLEGLRGMVIVTTDKCYENSETGQAFSESDRLGGRDPYSNSKACAELVTGSIRQSFWQSEIDSGKTGLATARAGNVIGGGDWCADRIVPDLIRACEKGAAARIRNPNSIRPWQHVLDLSEGYIVLAENLCEQPKAFSKAWNFGPDISARTFTVGDVVKQAKSILGDRLKWDLDPGPHPHEAVTLKLDCRLANQELKWRPKWQVDDSIRETFNWYESYLRAPSGAADVTFNQIEQHRNHR